MRTRAHRAVFAGGCARSFINICQLIPVDFLASFAILFGSDFCGGINQLWSLTKAGVNIQTREGRFGW